MPENEQIRERVEKLVALLVESHADSLRKQVTEQVWAELQGAISAAVPAESSIGALRGAIASLHEATTQTEILRALLDGSGAFCERSGLLVVRGHSAQGWQARGFADEQAFRSVVIDCERGLANRALSSQSAAAGTISDLDSSFAERFGAPHDGNVVLVPLIIKSKVAALVYADAGGQGTLDSDAIELLVESAATWLELQTLRRAAGLQEGNHRAQETQAEVQPPSQTSPAPVPAAVDPAAVHASVGTNGSLGIGTQARTPVAASEDEMHTKARRFAKLLVDEIKLYNQAKVTEGRRSRDLYDRLKEDIEKSRATYQRRYGHVNDVDYFGQELVRVLADNDATLLGASYSA